MKVIAGIQRRFLEHAVLNLFKQPDIVIGVIAFYLVCCGGGAPDKVLGKQIRVHDVLPQRVSADNE